MLPAELDGRRFLRALGRLVWRVYRQRGSHRTLANADKTAIVVVAFHDVIRRNSIRRALRETNIDESEFERAL
ncbi:MAG: type II toxin-antitoxin system HicA family toxin [Thermoplasmatota archaeon]